jgi:hypothetical protein
VAAGPGANRLPSLADRPPAFAKNRKPPARFFSISGCPIFLLDSTIMNIDPSEFLRQYHLGHADIGVGNSTSYFLVFTKAGGMFVRAVTDYDDPGKGGHRSRIPARGLSAP